MRANENQMQAHEVDPAQLAEQLDALEDKAGRISVPLSYADELYALRNNINLVRRKLEEISA
jgi:hypothetical protein